MLVHHQHQKKKRQNLFLSYVQTGAPALSIQGAADLEDVSIEYVDGSDLLTSELAKEDGEYDIIVAPTNVGAKVYSESKSV